MLLTPLVRVGRVASVMLQTDDPIQAAFWSESLSVLPIVLNGASFRSLYASLYAMSIAPFMLYKILEIQEESSRKCLEYELICLFFVLLHGLSQKLV